MTISLFEAKYSGECNRCLAEFHPGSLIGYTPDDELVCKYCAREIDTEEALTNRPVQGAWAKGRKR